MERKKPLTFKEYQKNARETAVYPDIGNNFVYPVLGISGEAGEIAEKVKKILRDDDGVISEETKQELIKAFVKNGRTLQGAANKLDVSKQYINQQFGKHNLSVIKRLFDVDANKEY